MQIKRNDIRMHSPGTVPIRRDGGEEMFRTVTKAQIAEWTERRGVWLHGAEAIKTLAKSVDNIVWAAVETRLIKRVSPVGDLVDWKVQGDDRVAFFKSRDEAEKLIKRAITDDIVKTCRAIRDVMRAAVPDHMVDADDELRRQREEMNDVTDSFLNHGNASALDDDQCNADPTLSGQVRSGRLVDGEHDHAGNRRAVGRLDGKRVFHERKVARRARVL